MSYGKYQDIANYLLGNVSAKTYTDAEIGNAIEALLLECENSKHGELRMIRQVVLAEANR